jgi:tetratricopeptide (TPR) repeat protein
MIVLVPTFAIPLIVLVNEHRLYLAMVGWCLLLAWFFRWLIGRRHRLALSGLATYTILLAILTLQRGQVWSDELTLWNDAAAKAPAMLRPHLRRADALEKKGQLPDAEKAYLRALALRPQHAATRNNLGVLYKKQHRLPEAEHQFRALLAVSPDIIQARLNLADLLLRQGQWRQAEVELLRALDFADTGGLAQKKLALIALQFAGDAERARVYGEQALALAEDAAIWTTQGVALRALGQVAQAEAAYRRALFLEPESIDTWFNLGNLYRDLQQPDKDLQAY